MMNTAQAHAHRNNLFCLLAESRLAWMGWLTVLALCCVVLPAPGCYSYLHRLELQTSRWVRSSECFDAALPRMEDDWTEILMMYCYLLFTVKSKQIKIFSLRNLSGNELIHPGSSRWSSLPPGSVQRLPSQYQRLHIHPQSAAIFPNNLRNIFSVFHLDQNKYISTQ